MALKTNDQLTSGAPPKNFNTHTPSGSSFTRGLPSRDVDDSFLHPVLSLWGVSVCVYIYLCENESLCVPWEQRQTPERHRFRISMAIRKSAGRRHPRPLLAPRLTDSPQTHTRTNRRSTHNRINTRTHSISLFLLKWQRRYSCFIKKRRKITSAISDGSISEMKRGRSFKWSSWLSKELCSFSHREAHCFIPFTAVHQLVLPARRTLIAILVCMAPPMFVIFDYSCTLSSEF